MARKGENIYKRKDGRWEGRYIKGRKPDGKALYGSVYGEKYGDAKLKLIPLKSAHAARANTKVSFTGTVRDWLLFWLNDLEKPNIKPSTYASYRNKLENHVLPALGNKKLDKLTGDNLQAWVDNLTEKGLSGSSVRTIYRIFNAALKKAVYKHCLFVNPCQDVILPVTNHCKICSLTFSQQKALENQAHQRKGNEAVIIALYTGMRIGEISALVWEDIDFENNIINVRRTLQRVMDYDGDSAKTKIITDIPKSNKSCRVIPFSNYLKKYLLDLKSTAKSNYIVSCKGHYTEPRVISYRFRQAAKSAGLDSVSFHGLRHTYATRCIELNVDIVTVSRLLGHASAKMTLDTYADSTLTQRKFAMASLDMLFGSNNKDELTADKQRFAALLAQLVS